MFGVCGAAVECLWIGPFMSDYDCSSCILGYALLDTAPSLSMGKNIDVVYLC